MFSAASVMAFHQGKFSFGPRGRCRHIEDGRPITDLTLVVRRHEYRQMVVSDNGKMREVPEALWRSTPKFRLAVWKGAVDAPKFSAQMLSVEGPIPISKIQQIRPRQILVRAGYIDFTGYDGTPDVTTKVSKIEEVEQIAKWRLERVHLLVPTKIAEDMTNTLAEYIFQWQKKERAISCIWVKTENAKELYKTLLDDAEITTGPMGDHRILHETYDAKGEQRIGRIRSSFLSGFNEPGPHHEASTIISSAATPSPHISPISDASSPTSTCSTNPQIIG
ncbi:unnamed protein product, partial [Mesorhabditis spiculigera]